MVEVMFVDLLLFARTCHVHIVVGFSVSFLNNYLLLTCLLSHVSFCFFTMFFSGVLTTTCTNYYFQLKPSSTHVWWMHLSSKCISFVTGKFLLLLSCTAAY
jgi:hypothetical protein